MSILFKDTIVSKCFSDYYIDGPTQKTFSGRDGQPLGVESLPVGILDLNLKEMSIFTLQSIELIMQNPRFPIQILGHNSSNLTSLVFNIVFDYYTAMSPVSHMLLIHELI